MTNVLVIGAGMSGLACAHTLLRADVHVDLTVVDAAPQPGGVVGTADIDGFRFESGPNTIQARSEVFRRIAHEVGIDDELIVSRSAASRRYLFHKGSLVALPGGPLSFLTSPLLSLGAKMRVLSEPLRRRRPQPSTAEEPTLEAFLSERIGREATRTLGGAFVRGVFAAEIEDLGARSAFPKLFGMVDEYGGLVRGAIGKRKASKGQVQDAAPVFGPETSRSDLLSFAGGLQRFPDALATELGPRLRLGEKVRKLTPSSPLMGLSGSWSVALESGEKIIADEVVLAVPAPQTVEWLQPLEPDVPRLDLEPLRELGHADLTIVHLGLDGNPLPEGFGFLVPPDEEGPLVPRALGVLFISQLFDGRAPEGCAGVTAIYRTADLGPDADEATAVRIAVEDLARGLCTQPPDVRVAATQRWSNVIPRYGVGHAAKVDAIVAALDQTYPSLHLAGSYRGGVSVEDCLARGRDVAHTVRARFKEREGAV